MAENNRLDKAEIAQIIKNKIKDVENQIVDLNELKVFLAEGLKSIQNKN